jgi:phosphatidylserine/phosphatidylglycerophosphate/cardiolipin synthase-like enzyme
VTATDWFLQPTERGNDATILDRRHPSGQAWTSGNDVRPFVHGAAYFAALVEAVRAMRAGDLLLFTDWRGDPDERLDAAGTEVSKLLCEAARAGVVVRGLVWRSHLDRLQFSEKENRHLGEEIDAAGGVCLLDQRIRPGGSHHQKFVVLRHPGRPELDCAFVGGIDLCHSRHDDASHAGDAQRQAMAAVYGPRPPWHDVQVRLRGPAVGDVEAVFRERWDDPAPLSRDPLHILRDRLQHVDPKRRELPEQLPDPAPCSTNAVQLLRTYPARRPGYPFAPDGERSVARGINKALERARRLIYIEDQYLWSADVAAGFCRALERQPDLLLIAVVPRFPDQDGRFSTAPNLVGRYAAMRSLHRAGGDRVAVFSPENHQGTPVYVHAKVCVIDDEWASVGSDNFNRRSWTHDSELACAVVDEPGPPGPGSVEHHSDDDGQGRRPYPLQLRLELAREHLDRPDGEDADLEDPRRAFMALATSAAALDAWHTAGRPGARPPGRLRPYPLPELSRFTRAWSALPYRAVYDPDGRPRSLRSGNRF